MLKHVKRRPTRIVAVLASTLSLVLVGSASYALHLEAMGPLECCKSHCQHEGTPARTEAERCCRTHLGVLPGALGKSAGAPDLSSASPLLLTLPAPPRLAVGAARRLPLRDVRAGPAPTLFAQHTSLVR